MISEYDLKGILFAKNRRVKFHTEIQIKVMLFPKRMSSHYKIFDIFVLSLNFILELFFIFA